MIPDDNNDDTEDPSAEPMDIDDELERAGKHGDSDLGPGIVGEDGEEAVIQPEQPDSHLD